MPHRRKGQPPHGPHAVEAGWIHNYEEELPLNEGLEMFSKILTTLSQRGNVRIAGTDVQPPPEAWFMLRYERMPRGELKLKMEIEWIPDATNTAPGHGPPQIE